MKTNIKKIAQEMIGKKVTKETPKKEENKSEPLYYFIKITDDEVKLIPFKLL